MRSIARGELSRFSRALSRSKKEAAQNARDLARLFKRGEFRPERCFVAERDGEIVARLAYWALPDSPRDLHIALFRFRRRRDGVALLRDTLRRVRGRSADCCVTGSGPALRALEDAGFRLAHDRCRYMRRRTTRLRVPDRLTYRPWSEVGERAYLDAILRVTKGTLDRMDGDDARRRGPRAAARTYLSVLKMVERPCDRWELAYDASGALAGLVVPQILRPGEGCINYIGVVPERRGHGYSRDLLARGVSSLRVREIVADIDVENRPLARALRAVGFRLRKRMRTMERRLG
ncbi:MAG: hypothetical protein HYY17_08130 [Planctomycetes bacterium]|nr:hypothetical protein [Planctomycetota bacterium]